MHGTDGCNNNELNDVPSIPPGPDAVPDDMPEQSNDLQPDSIVPNITALCTAQSFIGELCKVTLDRDPLPEDTCQRLCSPPTSLVDLSDKNLRLCLDLFLATSSGSEDMYTKLIAAI